LFFLGGGLYNKAMKLSQLKRLYDTGEGRFSGIPECCIDSYVKGMTLDKLMKRLKPKQMKEFLQSNYHYVPCLNCLRARRIVSIRSGISPRGKLLLKQIRRLRK
jgi:hypothetical protein